MRPVTIAKLVAVALVAAAGFLIGQSTTEEGEPSTERIRLAPDTAGEEDALTTIPPTAEPEPASSKRSMLRQRLKFARYLATCDIALLRPMLEETFASRNEDHEHSSAISTAWRKRDPDGFAAWVRIQPAVVPNRARGNSYVTIRDSFISEIATDDPEAAWKLAEEMGASEYTKWSILHGLVKRDPATALKLAGAHPEAGSGSMGYTGSQHSNTDPMQQLPILKTLHPGGGRAFLANEGANYYAQTPDKLDEAGAWFQQLPADAQRRIVVKLEQDGFTNERNPRPEIEEILPRLREIWVLPEE